jgi:hypothetical protein
MYPFERLLSKQKIRTCFLCGNKCLIILGVSVVAEFNDRRAEKKLWPQVAKLWLLSLPNI